MPNTNPFASKFLPWNPVINPRKPTPFGLNFDPTSIVDKRRLGTNPAASFPEQVGDPSAANAIPAAATPYSFMDEYKKVAGNRPNRMAYQQAVEEGSPVINRGKWAKFGAAFSAGASALGGAPADRAAKFGLDAYYAPQGRSDARYKEKVEGLGKLAGMEDQDITENLRALETDRGEYWKGQENDRQNRTTKIMENADLRAAGLSNMQMKKLEYDLAHQGEAEFTGIDGIKRVINDKGETVRVIGKEKLSPAEQVEQKGAEQAAIVTANAPERQNDLDIALGKAKSVADSKAAALAQQKELALLKIKQQAKDVKPGDAYGNVLNMMTAAVTGNTLSPRASSFIKQGPLGNLIVERGMFDFATEENTAAELEANKWLSENMDKQYEQPKIDTAAKPGATDATRNYPKNPDGTTTIYAPTGESMPVSDPEKIKQMLAGGGSLTPIGAKGAKPELFNRQGVGLQEPTAAPINTPPPAPPAPIPQPVGNVPPPNIAPPPAPSTPIPPPANNKINFNMLQNQTPPKGVPPIAPQGLFGMQEGSNPTLANSFRMGQNAPPPPPIPAGNGMPQGNAVPLGQPPPPNMAANQGGMPQPPPGNPIQLGGAPPMPPARVPQAPIRIGPPEGDFNTLGNVPGGGGGQQLPPPMAMQPNPIRIAPPNTAPPTVGKTQLEEPNTPERFQSILDVVKQRMLKEAGVNIKVGNLGSTRTPEQQKKLYDVGRGKDDKRPTLTDADGTKLLSKHQSGRAADVMFFDPKTGKQLRDQKLYNQLGKIAKEEGLIWGGDWKTKRDYVHIQLGEGLDKPEDKK